jgi:hypothetical protein
MPRRPPTANGGAANRQDGGLDVEALVTQMNSRISDGDFLMQSCSRLVLNITQAAEAFARMDATPLLTTLIQAMKAHPRAADLQANILALIMQCTQNSRPNRVIFFREGGIEMIVAAMTANRHASVSVHANASLAIYFMKDDL